MSAATMAAWLLEVDKWKTWTISLLEGGDRSRNLAVGDTVLAKVGASKEATLFRVHKIEYEGPAASLVELMPIDNGHNDHFITTSLAAICGRMAELQYVALDEHIPHGVLLRVPLRTQSLNAHDASKAEACTGEVVCTIHTGFVKLREQMELLNEGRQNSTSSVAYMETITAELGLFLDRFRLHLKALSDAVLILACALHLTTSDNSHVTSGVTVAVAPTSEQVQPFMQDLESESPEKKKPERLSASGSFTSSVARKESMSNLGRETVLALQAVVNETLAPLLQIHPVPLLVTVSAFMQSVEALHSVHHACTVLCDAARRLNARDDLSTAAALLCTTLTTAVQDFTQRGAYSIVTFHEQSALDFCVRQDWQGDSKYLRDKKVTHGVTALCTSVRAAVWDMYACKPGVYWGPQESLSACVSKISLQLLLSTSLQVCRYYTGDYPAQDTAQGSQMLVTERYISPSKVRTAQWRRDLYSFVTSALDTLAWIITQDTVRYVGANIQKQTDGTTPLIENLCRKVQECGIRRDGAGGTAAVSVVDRQALLGDAQYVDQVEIVRELLQVLRYVLLGLYISTTAQAEEMIGKVKPLLAQPGSLPSISATAAGKERDLWGEIQEVVTCLSPGQPLVDALAAEVNGTPGASTAVCAPHSGEFDITTDVLVGAGLHAEVPQPSVTTLQVNAAFDRIDLMAIIHPGGLLRLLRDDVSALISVYAEMYGEAEEDLKAEPARVLRKFVVEMLSRRYEVNPAAYPPLSAHEQSVAGVINEFIASLT